ncbi:MAG: hypothetical protein QG596_296 [Actinomycetota bacterium]|jgi:hypothetical protein|nr:hypothetical protein [Actinomycetota bacterium]
MSSPLFARRRIPAALTAFAVAFLFIAGFNQGSASAADVTTGNVAITIPSGKAGMVSAVKPAKLAKRIGKKGAKVTSTVSEGTFDTKASARVAGGIRFANGKRKVTITSLNVAVYGKRAVISGKLGGKKMNVFNAFGTSTLETANGLARLSGGKLSFTKAAAGKLRNSLKLKKSPTGRIGGLYVNVKTTFSDQYTEQCGVPVSSRALNSWPEASALPTLGSPTATTAPTSFNWGFRASFRGYVYGTMTAGGKADQALQPLDGATRTFPPFDPTRGFAFPVSGGQHAANGAGAADDQAVINGTGTALFCNSEHSFWASISDPTIVIDGVNSRIVATISQNINGNGMFGELGPWQTPQRVDLADLDLAAITPVESEAGITYTDIPASLSESAAPFATYPAGTTLDPITVTVGG